MVNGASANAESSNLTLLSHLGTLLGVPGGRDRDRKWRH